MSLNAGQGPGNLVADKHYMQFLAGEAISRGEIVSVSADETTDTGYAVILADTDVATSLAVIGVAAEDIADGAWGKIQIAGFCDYMVTDGSVAEGQLLHPCSTAGAADSTAITTANSMGFGIALADDSSTTLTAAYLFRRI